MTPATAALSPSAASSGGAGSDALSPESLRLIDPDR